MNRRLLLRGTNLVPKSCGRLGGQDRGSERTFGVRVGWLQLGDCAPRAVVRRWYEFRGMGLVAVQIGVICRR
ncbi:MAG: hypothetical protein M3256_20575 [Actinomycetota bacterium]|nr:hypothetical protein [Actinomycetota bacterium]